jgi:hypothetical protein
VRVQDGISKIKKLGNRLDENTLGFGLLSIAVRRCKKRQIIGSDFRAAILCLSIIDPRTI